MTKRRPISSHSGRTAKRQSEALVHVASPRVTAAQSLWREGRYDDALALFDEALRQEANNAQAYFAAARAHGEMFDFGRMDGLHDRLIARAPRQPGVHHYIAENLSALKLSKRAIASYESALEVPGVGPLTWTELASLYERTHQLEEAEELVDRAVRVGFDEPRVHFVRGRILRRQGQFNDAEAIFRNLGEMLPAESDLACRAWGEVALMWDKAGDFQRAVGAIERCKQGQQAHSEPVWQLSNRMQLAMQELLVAFTSEDLRRWRAELQQSEPRQVALLTGFPRSGTTLLEQMLDAHPDVVSSEEHDVVGRLFLHSAMRRQRNTPLFNVLNGLRANDIEAARQRYFEAMEYLLGEPIDGRMHLDKNPAYNSMLPVVFRLFPEMRIIIALRDPRDVVLSCYLRYLPLNPMSVHFLDIERTAARYASDMSAWLRMRDLIETPWCGVRYEDMVANAERQARRALATMGMSWDDSVLNYREHSAQAKQVSSPSYEAVAEPIYTRAIGRWKNYQHLLEPAMKTLEPFIREFGYDV